MEVPEVRETVLLPKAGSELVSSIGGKVERLTIRGKYSSGKILRLDINCNYDLHSVGLIIDEEDQEHLFMEGETTLFEYFDPIDETTLTECVNLVNNLDGE